MWIFGYGSLINVKSVQRSLPKVDDLIPVRITGYQREFRIASSYRVDHDIGLPISVLNLVKSADSKVNGVAFFVDDSDYEILCDREKVYQPKPCIMTLLNDTREAFEGVFFQAVNKPLYPFLEESKVQFDYLQECLAGCDNFGDDFKQEFRESTFFPECNARRIWALSSQKKKSAT